MNGRDDRYEVKKMPINDELKLDEVELPKFDIPEYTPIDVPEYKQPKYVSPKIEAPKETVESRMTGLLSKGSDYRTLAETQAKKEANKRGLLNSAMAVTAGQRAAIESALPIATQDAQYWQNAALNKQQGSQQAQLYGVQGDVFSQEARQKNIYDINKQREQNLFEREKLKYTTAAETAWKKLDLETRVNLDLETLNADQQERYNKTTDNIGAEYQRDYLAILVEQQFDTPEDRQAALDSLNVNTKKRFELAAAIARADLTWEPPAEMVNVPPGIGTTKPVEPPPETDWYRQYNMGGEGY